MLYSKLDQKNARSVHLPSLQSQLRTHGGHGVSRLLGAGRDSPLGAGLDTIEVVELPVVPDLPEVPAVEPVGLVLVGVALVAVEAPVAPVDVGLLEEAHEVLPGDVLLVGPELPEEEGHAQIPHVGLLARQLALESVVGPQVPAEHQPREALEVPCVDQLVGTCRAYLTSSW